MSASERGGRCVEVGAWVGPFVWVQRGDTGEGTDGWGRGRV